MNGLFTDLTLSFNFEGVAYTASDLVVLTEEAFNELFDRVVDWGCDLYIQLETALLWSSSSQHATAQIGQIVQALAANSVALDALEEEFLRREALTSEQTLAQTAKREAIQP
jgi:hypothetical protein